MTKDSTGERGIARESPREPRIAHQSPPEPARARQSLPEPAWACEIPWEPARAKFEQVLSKIWARFEHIPVWISAIICVICIFRPVVWTGAWTCHLTISQILNKSTKISKNQNKPTQLPVITTGRKIQISQPIAENWSGMIWTFVWC